ncbi:EAL domain-containing protein [Vibrio rumoiensis]|uniref:EAL domain-containing protein n=1 Tax=Vibrio rumoiensis TaxID=76258 RepID=A0ABW7IZE5_9VIBR
MNKRHYNFRLEIIKSSHGHCDYEVLSRPEGIKYDQIDEYFRELSPFEALNLIKQTFDYLSAFEGIKVSININRSMIVNELLHLYLKSRVESIGKRISIVFEINECCYDLIGSEVFIRFRNTFNEMSVDFWLDDFGTGGANFSLLKLGIFDTIKIDKNLFWMLYEYGGTLLLEFITFIRRLNFNVIIEGVETAEQLDFAYESGCFAQGFYFKNEKVRNEILY